MFLIENADGPEGVRSTLALMRRLVKDYRIEPGMILVAEQIIESVAEKDFLAEAQAIHEWVRDNIRYTLDPNEAEVLKPPPLLLLERYGDCDDLSTLEATLLEAVGHPTRFVAAAFDSDAFSHVFVETKIGDRWIASDTTEPHGLGWAPEGVLARMVRHV